MTFAHPPTRPGVSPIFAHAHTHTTPYARRSRLEQQSSFKGFVRDYRADVLSAHSVHDSSRRADSNLRHGLGLPSAPTHAHPAAMGFHTDRPPQRTSPALLPSLHLERRREAQRQPASTGA